MIIDEDWVNQLKVSDPAKLIHCYSEITSTSKKQCHLNLSNKQMFEEINMYFRNTLQTDIERQKQVNELNCSFKLCCLPDNTFDWIDLKNPRQCYFVWLLVRLLDFPLSDDLQPSDLIINTSKIRGSRTREYDKFDLANKPSNALECKKIIIFLFFLLPDSNEFKNGILDNFKRKWKEVEKLNHKIFNHIDHVNQEHAKWFWSYLTSNIGIPSWYLEPMKDSEYFPCARAVLDIWEQSIEGKTLALDKAYHAFHSKKFKLKPEKERGANIWLGADEKNQLAEIAKKKGISEKLALKRLINVEFTKISK